MKSINNFFTRLRIYIFAVNTIKAYRKYLKELKKERDHMKESLQKLEEIIPKTEWLNNHLSFMKTVVGQVDILIDKIEKGLA